MRERIITFFDFIIYWMIVLIPFSVAIAPAPMNVFMGVMIFSFAVKKILKKEKLFLNTAINLPFLFLVIISAISLLNSVCLKDSIRGVLRLAQYALVFLAIVDGVKDIRHIRRIFISMALGAGFISLDGIWQVIFGKDIVRGYLPIINIGLIRATASFKDSNVMGIYLSAIFPLCAGITLYYFMVQESIKHFPIPLRKSPKVISEGDFLENKTKILMAITNIIILAGILLTYSRPTLLAVYLSLLFLAVARRDRLLVSILLILVITAPFLMPKSVRNWAKQVDYNPLRFMCNDDRIAVYRNSLNMIRHHPIIGLGANTYMKNYKKYKENPEYRNVVTSDYMYAHNNFLQMAAEIGLLGLGIFFWLLLKLFKKCFSTYYNLRDNYLKIVSLSLIACLIAFLINGLTETSLYYSRVAIIFWYLVGFALALEKFIYVSKPRTN